MNSKSRTWVIAAVAFITLLVAWKLLASQRNEGYGASPYSSWLVKLATDLPPAYQTTRAVNAILAEVRDQLQAMEDQLQPIPCSSITRYISPDRIAAMLPLASASEVRKTIANVRALVLRVEGENCVQGTTTPARAASRVQMLIDST